MAEKVMVRPVGSNREPRSMDARLAQYLVYRGRYEYASAGDRSTYAMATDRQGAASTEVEFTPSETLDVTPEKKGKPKKKRTYKRRDMKAEE